MVEEPFQLNEKEIHINYLKSRKKLVAAVGKAINVSVNMSGEASKHSREFWASVIFTKMLLGCISTIKMLPHTDDDKAFDHWDYSSVASIARNTAEAYFLFYHLCVEELNDENEWQARQQCMRIKDSKTRIKMMRFQDPSFNSTEFDNDILKTTQKLSQNPYFLKLSEKKRKEILKGDKGLFIQDDILEKISMDRGTFRATYTFLSSHVHSLPMSFFRNHMFTRGNGDENSYDKLAMLMASDLSLFFIIKATKEYKNLKKKYFSIGKGSPFSDNKVKFNSK